MRGIGITARLNIRPSTFTLINYRALERRVRRGEPIEYEPPNIPLNSFRTK